MKTINRAHSILAAITPIAGVSATGVVTATSTGGNVTVPARLLGYPVPVSASGNAELDPTKAVRVSAETVVDADGASVPVESVWGSQAHNLAAGTVIRWQAPPAGLSPTAVVAAPGLAGSSRGTIKRAVIYEGIGPGTSAKDLWLAKAGGVADYPSLVLSWESSQDYEVAGQGRALRADVWTMVVVVQRVSSADARALEGLNLLDDLEEALVGATTEPLGSLSHPALAILGRDRVTVTDGAFIYSLRFATHGGVRRRESRTFSPWEATRMQHVSEAGVELPVPGADPVEIVDQTVEMPQDP